MVLTDDQIKEALNQTADSFGRRYKELASRPSASYRVDSQVWTPKEVRGIEGLATPLITLREILSRKPSTPVERSLVAFYLAYGSDRSDYRESIKVGGVLINTDFKSDEIFGITQHETEVIYKTVEEIIADKNEKFSFRLDGGFELPWGWAMGTRFKQYVDDTSAVEELARMMEQ